MLLYTVLLYSSAVTYMLLCAVFPLTLTLGNTQNTINQLDTVSSPHDIDALNDLICRRFADNCPNIILSSAGPPTSVTLHTLYTSDHNIALIITSASKSALLQGLSYYLKTYCNTTLSEFGVSNTGFQLVYLDSQETLHVNHLVRYYGNICAYSYSYWWWGWEEWQKHIDWIALRGFNLVLVPVGIEAIHKAVFMSVGLSNETVYTFFNGPAYLAWSRMGNMYNFTGPLNDLFLEQQVSLHHNITHRLNALGISVVLPGFAGFVPSRFGEIHGWQDINNVSCWLGFNGTYSCLKQIDPTSPLYIKISTMFIKQLITVFATNHFYSVDMFNENTPTNQSLTYLKLAGAHTVRALQHVDTQAVWVLQGWMFGYDNFWRNSRVKAYLEDVPRDEVLILDMFAEYNPTWRRTGSFFGKHFLWTVINNFGGNTVLNGNIVRTVSDLHDVFVTSEYCVGFGFMPEGIYENTMLLDAAMNYVMLNVTHITPDLYLSAWRSHLPDYRYGGLQNLTTVTDDIIDKLYVDDQGRYYDRCIIYQKPALSLPFHHDSNLYDIRDVLHGMLDTISDQVDYSRINREMWYDLITISQTYAEQIFYLNYANLMTSYNKSDKPGIDYYKSILLKIIDILDDTSSYLPDRAVSCYLDKLERFAGTHDMDKRKLQHDYLLQITLWGSEGEVLDYAFKMWSGMLKYYYRKRWEIFFKYVEDSVVSGNFDIAKYETEIFDFEKGFVHKTGFGKCKSFEPKNIEHVVDNVLRLIGLSTANM